MQYFPFTFQCNSEHPSLYLLPRYGCSFHLLSPCYWRRQWHPTPVLLPGKSHGWRSLVGCSPWGTKSRTRLSNFTLTFHFHALEEEMATHSSILAWRIPWTEEPGGLPSMWSHRVRHNWSDLAAAVAAAALVIGQLLCWAAPISWYVVLTMIPWNITSQICLHIGILWGASQTIDASVPALKAVI